MSTVTFRQRAERRLSLRDTAARGPEAGARGPEAGAPDEGVWRYSLLPFVAVAVVGQLSATWEPGLSSPGYYWLSTVLLIASISLALSRKVWNTSTLVPAVLYVASVCFLELSAGGGSSGLGALLLVPVVAVALYGQRWESVAVVCLVVIALFSVSFAGTQIIQLTLRKVILLGALGIAIPISIHALRDRLVDSNERKTRLLQQAKAMGEAARQLASLLDPSQITALGAELAAQIASPPGCGPRRAVYFRIDKGKVKIDAQFDETGKLVDEEWPLDEHPALKSVVQSGEPIIGPLDQDSVGPILRSVVQETGVTHGAWVPVRPEKTLHGVLAVASRGVPITEDCLERCVALGHLLELALSNWAAHEKLEQQATAE
ncbi:MAG TPA: hypothetical protein VEJ87_03260, partial [Acidimicrobiales bacterium]|nr:hypothetical protein [Acidimicrobiales bacterium]